VPVRLLAFPLVALLACSSPSRPAPAADLVARCVAAYGGPAAVRAGAAFRQEGTVTSVLHPGATGRIARLYQRPGRLRVETAWPDGQGEIRVLDGARGWRDGAPAAGPPFTAMVLQAARLDLPAILSARGAKVAERGTWEHEGKRLRVLAVEVDPGVEVEAGIDPASGRILRSRSVGAPPSGGAPPVEFVTTYSDFREVDGVLFAFREGNWASGATTGETVLAAVAAVPAVPDGMFAP
jgi:hypothetical protein